MQTTKLSMTPGGVLPVVHASQYDTGRLLTFNLYDGATPYTIPAGSTVLVEGVKEDNHAFQYAVESFSGNQVVVKLSQQMTAVAGPVECQIRVQSSTADLGTVNFILSVEEGPLNDSTVISDTDLPLIIALATEQMLRAEAAADAADLSEQHAKTSEDNAALSEQHAKSSEDNAALSEQHAAAYESDASTYATAAESYCHGGTGTRTGEDTDNSEYWAGRSATDAARAKDEADRAAQYAGFVTPSFILQNNRLYVKTDHTIDFIVANNRLYIKLAA